MEGTKDSDIGIVFSDVDGTLVHYHDETEQEGNRILKLPPSATGMQGIISSKTMVYCRELRHQKQKLVLISGMRTTTLLKRLPYLPRADAYCSEAGGRIFYPSEPTNDDDSTFTPVPFDGASESDLTPFCLVEDLEWRERMQQVNAAGRDGNKTNGFGSQPLVADISKRNGLLWEYAQTLVSMGYVLDTKGYSTCFRVNRKQQTTVTDKEFDDLLNGKVARPTGVGTSTNLGCVDFYPIASGKKNCCEYLARKFCIAKDDESVLSKHAICLCDDDNDLEMALACEHAYIPSVSSDSMSQVISANPRQFTVTAGPQGTRATEKALELVLEQVQSSSS